MRIESNNGEVVVMYREKSDHIVANNIIIVDKNIDKITTYIDEILTKFKDLGYQYLCTNPPTGNPLVALKLIECRNDSRIFAGVVEIERNTKAFDKYINFLNDSGQTHQLQCRVENNRPLNALVYVSYPLNGPASPPFRYINYDENGDVIDITEGRPKTNTFDITDRFYPGDEKKFDINIVKNKKITVKRKNNG